VGRSRPKAGRTFPTGHRCLVGRRRLLGVSPPLGEAARGNSSIARCEWFAQVCEESARPNVTDTTKARREGPPNFLTEPSPDPESGLASPLPGPQRDGDRNLDRWIFTIEINPDIPACGRIEPSFAEPQFVNAMGEFRNRVDIASTTNNGRPRRLLGGRYRLPSRSTAPSSKHNDRARKAASELACVMAYRFARSTNCSIPLDELDTSADD
jgi:hypothetical protein